MFQISALTDELSFDTIRALNLAQQFELPSVEVHVAWGKNIEELDDDELKRLRDELERRNLRVCNLASTVFFRCQLDDREEEIPSIAHFPSVSGRYADHLRALERAFSAARCLEAPSVRIFGFWRGGQQTTAETFDRAVELVAKAVQMAETEGLRLALENCPYGYFGSGALAGRLVRMVDSPWLRLLWDPCGALRAGEHDYLEASRGFRDLIAHVHAKDIVIDPSLKRGRSYVAIGRGQMNWPAVMDRLVEYGYQGAISLETHHLGSDGTRESAAIPALEGLLKVYTDLQVKE
jgi:L-ribulose-5-phosphate 3-epimerase